MQSSLPFIWPTMIQNSIDALAKIISNLLLMEHNLYVACLQENTGNHSFLTCLTSIIPSSLAFFLHPPMLFFPMLCLHLKAYSPTPSTNLFRYHIYFHHFNYQLHINNWIIWIYFLISSAKMQLCVTFQ